MITGEARDRRSGCFPPLAKRRLILRAAVGSMGLNLLHHTPGLGQTFPSRPVRIIVPFAPGGGTDIAARILADQLSMAWTRPVVVENRSGAAGTIGTGFVAGAAPDGHTVALVTGSHTINAALFTTLPFDPVRSFAPIGLVATYAYLLVVNPQLPVRTVAELISYVKARPGAMSYASTGNGSPNHLAMEMLKAATGMELTQVPYRGSTPALQDVVANNVPILIDPLVTSLPLVQAGQLRALAVSTPQRSPLVPEIPTIAEASGVPGFDLTGWLGLLAPARTPPEIIARFNAEVGRILGTADVKRRFEELGQSPATSTPEDFASLLPREIERWRPIIRATGARPTD